MKIFIKFGIYPSEALIVEDSHYGREAAISSGAKLLPIKKNKKADISNEQKVVNHEDLKDNQDNEDPEITRRKRRRSSAGNE